MTCTHIAVFPGISHDTLAGPVSQTESVARARDEGVTLAATSSPVACAVAWRICNRLLHEKGSDCEIFTNTS